MLGTTPRKFLCRSVSHPRSVVNAEQLCGGAAEDGDLSVVAEARVRQDGVNRDAVPQEQGRSMRRRSTRIAAVIMPCHGRFARYDAEGDVRSSSYSPAPIDSPGCQLWNTFLSGPALGIAAIGHFVVPKPPLVIVPIKTIEVKLR